MSKTTTFEKIAASVPSNATAATVTGKGSQYEPAHHGNRSYSEAPPLMQPIPPEAEHCSDLLGARFGRLIVLGLAAEQNGRCANAPRAQWVVRCSCSYYELRTAKTIRSAPANDMCQRCRHWEISKHRYQKRGGISLDELARRSRR